MANHGEKFHGIVREEVSSGVVSYTFYSHDNLEAYGKDVDSKHGRPGVWNGSKTTKSGLIKMLGEAVESY